MSTAMNTDRSAAFTFLLLEWVPLLVLHFYTCPFVLSRWDPCMQRYYRDFHDVARLVAIALSQHAGMLPSY